MNIYDYIILASVSFAIIVALTFVFKSKNAKNRKSNDNKCSGNCENCKFCK